MTDSRFIQDPTIDDLRGLLKQHSLYEQLRNMQGLRSFMEHHVFAVWDFMSVVKSLQQELTCVAVPWIPSEDPEAARLINDIVLGEETDVRPDGSFVSHFQLYLEAMEEAGANTTGITRFVETVTGGTPVSEALLRTEVPAPAQAFVTDTFGVIEGSPAHVRAAALLYGREDLIPEMFIPMVERLRDAREPCGQFVYYLERHIEVDGGEHSELAEGILKRLCGESETRKEEARETAQKVLRSRLTFWDQIEETIAAELSPASVMRSATDDR